MATPLRTGYRTNVLMQIMVGAINRYGHTPAPCPACFRRSIRDSPIMRLAHCQGAQVGQQRENGTVAPRRTYFFLLIISSICL